MKYAGNRENDDVRAIVHAVWRLHVMVGPGQASGKGVETKDAAAPALGSYPTSVPFAKVRAFAYDWSYS